MVQKTSEQYKPELKQKRSFLRKSLAKHVGTVVLVGAALGSFRSEVSPGYNPRSDIMQETYFDPWGSIPAIPFSVVIGYGIYRIRRDEQIEDLKIAKEEIKRLK